MKATASLDASQFARLSPFIRSELRKLALTGAVSAAAALRQVFIQLFGSECSRRDEARFMLFAAPIARRIAIEIAPRSERIGDSDVSTTDLQEWLTWLDTFDPMCARMIDLHYFAGLSTKETARALDMPPQAVIRDLRFAKAWLHTKVV
jgi:DNA-directed RNA polymerase specialized sigma24 family protein